MGTMFSVNQKITLAPIEDEIRRKEYAYSDKHIGNHGIIVDYECIGFNESQDLYIYTIKLEDGDIIQVPEEMLSFYPKVKH